MMSEQQKMDQERVAFEAAYASIHGSISAGELRDLRRGDDYAESTAERLNYSWRIWQARASLPVGAPEGWKMVPVEPTPDMINAAEEAHMPFGDMDIALRMAILSAPAAHPATEQSAPGEVRVTVELLERVCREDGHSNDMALEELRALLAQRERGGE